MQAIILLFDCINQPFLSQVLLGDVRRMVVTFTVDKRYATESSFTSFVLIVCFKGVMPHQRSICKFISIYETLLE